MAAIEVSAPLGASPFWGRAGGLENQLGGIFFELNIPSQLHAAMHLNRRFEILPRLLGFCTSMPHCSNF